MKRWLAIYPGRDLSKWLALSDLFRQDKFIVTGLSELVYGICMLYQDNPGITE